ncbi:ankyrin repeat domain-containing protein 1-like [Periplaneta americana]|uniref:ankyrin repeat domain-containing protein 1-like n=1 Tax=Periplaneta americana TaxID=6978 RepID=UPI0037E81C56
MQPSSTMSIGSIQAQTTVPAPLQLLLLQLFNLVVHNITNATNGNLKGTVAELLDLNATYNTQLEATHSFLENNFQEQQSFLEKKLNTLDTRFEEQNILISKRIGDDKNLLVKKWQEQTNLMQETHKDQNAFIKKKFKDYNDLLEKKFLDQKALMEKRFEEQYKFIRDKFENYKDFLEKKIQEHNGFMEKKLDYHNALQNKKEDNILKTLDKLEKSQSKAYYGKDTLRDLRKELAALSKSERERRLLEASTSGNATLVMGLLQVGTNFSIADETTRTPLHAAADNNQVDVVRILLDAGAPINGKTKQWNATAMHYGCGSPDVLYLLLDRGAFLEERSEYGGTPLHWAAWNNHLEGAQALVARGADIHATTYGGSTPLHQAQKKNHKSLVDFLSQLESQLT